MTDVGLLETISKPTGNSSTRRQINVHLLEEHIDYGMEGKLHPKIAQAQRAPRERKILKKVDKQQGLAPADMPVSPIDIRDPDSSCHQMTHLGRRTPYLGHEATLNHSLTIH